MDDQEAFTKKASFFMKQSKYDIMVGLARDRGDDAVAGVMREAIDDYIQRKQNPEHLIDQMATALKEHPELLGPVISAEVQRQLHIELQRTFGKKF